MKRINYLLLLLGLFSVSCQEEVFIALDEHERIPVIEASWTNVPGLNQIIITYTQNYYEVGHLEVEENAEVYIVNEQTKAVIRFHYVPQTNSYLPLNSQAAIIGQPYTLYVNIGENQYRSAGMVLEPPTLDSIAVNFKEERLFQQEGYYLTVYGDIPFEQDNYYRMRIVRNDTILNRRNDYLLFDDSFGNQILNRGFELSGFAFQPEDRVRLELYRMNKTAFDYLSELVGLLYNDGGLFSPPPQNPTSNFIVANGTGKVLGYFMVGSVVTSQVLIEGREAD